MILSLFLYQDDNLVLSINNQKFTNNNDTIIFTYQNDTYNIRPTKENFIFKKENIESLLTIDYQKNEYIYHLNEVSKSFSLLCTYQKYQYNPNDITFTYKLDTANTMHKINIKIKKESD